MRTGGAYHEEEEGGDEAEHGNPRSRSGGAGAWRFPRGDQSGGGFLERLRVRVARPTTAIEYEGDSVALVRDEWMEGGSNWSRPTAMVARRVRREFIPRDSTRSARLPGANTRRRRPSLQERLGGGAQIEVAGRYEQTNVNSQFLNIDRSFDAISVAAGASIELAPFVRAGVNLSRSERAPSAEELYSNGPHIATQAFEIGDPGFDTERSVGGEAFVRWVAVRIFTLSATLYYNRFDQFIYSPHRAEEDGLPLLQYARRCRTLGLRAGRRGEIAQVGDVRFGLEGAADYVEVTIASRRRCRASRLCACGRACRRAPMRSSGRIEAEHIFAQDRIADLETRPMASPWSMRR